VIRVAIGYAVVAWLIVEVASVMFPGLLLPDWTVRLVIGLAIIGFPIAIVLAWAVELTPGGIKAEAATSDRVEQSLPEPAKRRSTEGFDSIAVLPFLNLSNDPENEYFSDGMSEELLNLLCKLPQLTVASRTSSFSFKGKNVDMGTVAKQLAVDVILEGSVRRSGDRVRITAQLIDVHSDRHLWSETYDRELKDVFAVQDEIARNIVQALELSLTPVQQRSIQKRATTLVMEAYDYYLRGRYYFERGEWNHALRMFEKAIELDENYGLAWAGAADCHSWKCLWLKKTPESQLAAEQNSRKALQLAPSLAEAHTSRMMALIVGGKYEEAEDEFKLAVKLDPQLFEAYYYLGRVYFAQGKFDEAVDAFKQAQIIRPDSVTASTLLTTSLRSAGRKEEALESTRKSVVVAERHLSFNPDDALALSRGATDLIYMGEIDKAIEWAERAYSINPKVCHYNVACVFVLAGHIERALDLLEEHAQSSALDADWVMQDSDWDAARDHPRFGAIIESLRSN